MAFRRRVGESDMLTRSATAAATVAASIYTTCAHYMDTHRTIYMRETEHLAAFTLKYRPYILNRFFSLHFVSFQEKLLFIAVATQQTCHMGMCDASVMCA